MTIVASESTPLLGHRRAGTASVLRTYGNILISIIGAGVLGLPYTFKVGGWAVGATDVVLAALLSYYCMLLLVSVSASLTHHNSQNFYKCLNCMHEENFGSCL